MHRNGLEPLNLFNLARFANKLIGMFLYKNNRNILMPVDEYNLAGNMKKLNQHKSLQGDNRLTVNIQHDIPV